MRQSLMTTANRESKRERLSRFKVQSAFLLSKVCINKCLQAFSTKIEKLLAIVVFLLLGEPVLCLRDLELALALHGNEAHTEIRATYSI